VPPDHVFGSQTATRFINKILQGGKKTTAERIFYGAMSLVAERTGDNPLETLRNSMRNTMPNLEVKPRRVGGATYQVPVEVTRHRRDLDARVPLTEHAGGLEQRGFAHVERDESLDLSVRDECVEQRPRLVARSRAQLDDGGRARHLVDHGRGGQEAHRAAEAQRANDSAGTPSR